LRDKKIVGTIAAMRVHAFRVEAAGTRYNDEIVSVSGNSGAPQGELHMADYQHLHIYERQLEYLASQDVENMITNQYTDDAYLLNFTHYVVGHAALVEYFKGYLQNLGYVKLISTDKYTETPDAIFFEATVETAGGIARVYDVFTMRDGKISRHFAGLINLMPKESALT
jgi:hypothetical protein